MDGGPVPVASRQMVFVDQQAPVFAGFSGCHQRTCVVRLHP